jgi:PKD repeat protein
MSVNFTDVSYDGKPTTWEWSFPGGTPATSNLQNQTVVYNAAGTYDVSLTVTNAFGNNTKTRTGYVKVMDVVGGNSAPWSEGFENMSSFPSGGWSVINDGGTTWERTNTAASTDSYSARVENFSNANIKSTKDVMITPSFDLTSAKSGGVTFKLAHAMRNSTTADRLTVYVSSNCGESWTQRYSKTGTALANAGQVTTNFIPNSSQWRNESLTLSSSHYGKPNVMFKFEFNYADGNNIYIDDINLNVTTSVENIVKESYGFGVYPNPLEASSVLKFTMKDGAAVQVKVLDMLGREVATMLEGKLNAGQHEFQIPALESAGVYMLKAVIGNDLITERIIAK